MLHCREKELKFHQSSMFVRERFIFWFAFLSLNARKIPMFHFLIVLMGAPCSCATMSWVLKIMDVSLQGLWWFYMMFIVGFLHKFSKYLTILCGWQFCPINQIKCWVIDVFFCWVTQKKNQYHHEMLVSFRSFLHISLYLLWSWMEGSTDATKNWDILCKIKCLCNVNDKTALKTAEFSPSKSPCSTILNYATNYSRLFG